MFLLCLALSLSRFGLPSEDPKGAFGPSIVYDVLFIHVLFHYSKYLSKPTVCWMLVISQSFTDRQGLQHWCLTGSASVLVHPGKPYFWRELILTGRGNREFPLQATTYGPMSVQCAMMRSPVEKELRVLQSSVHCV